METDSTVEPVVEETAPVKLRKTRDGPTVRQMFLQRLEGEGRIKEWYQKLREYQKRTKERFSQASWVVMREMGYTTPDAERRLYAEWQAREGKSRMQLQIAKERAEIREEQRGETFAEAVKQLPDHALRSVELAWIHAHEAMHRLNRAKDKTKPILLTPEDVLRPAHGPAPSKAAVNSLQHWVNHPHEFFKTMDRKAGEEGGPAEEERAAEDLAEVERILKEVVEQGA